MQTSIIRLHIKIGLGLSQGRVKVWEATKHLFAALMILLTDTNRSLNF